MSYLARHDPPSIYSPVDEEDPFYTNSVIYHEPPYYPLEVKDPYTSWPSTSGFDEDHIP
jgi:hypothetical protein